MTELNKHEKTMSDLTRIVNALENKVAQVEEESYTQIRELQEENADLRNVVTDHEGRIGVLEQENDCIENILTNFVELQEEIT